MRSSIDLLILFVGFNNLYSIFIITASSEHFNSIFLHFYSGINFFGETGKTREHTIIKLTDVIHSLCFHTVI